jgi:hypothetical protein
MYKYITNDTPQFFSNGRLRFTQPGQFNDPFELLPNFTDIMGERTKAFFLKNAEKWETKNRKHAKWYKKLIPKSVKLYFLRFLLTSKNKDVVKLFQLVDEFGLEFANNDFRGFIDKSYGILCLSEISDNLIMWAHYGNCHKGFVLEFDVKHPFFNQDIENTKTGGVLDYAGRPLPVTYSKERKTIPYWDKSMLEIFLTKGIDWADEKEHRMVLPFNMASEVINDDIHLFTIPFASVKSVIFGARSDDTFIEASRYKIQAWSEYHSEFQLFKYELDSSKFSLERIKI